MKMQNVREPEFVVRCYEKGELALLFFPSLGRKAAGKKLRRWMCRCRPLMEALQGEAYCLNSRYYSAREVRAIVHYLGEP